MTHTVDRSDRVTRRSAIAAALVVGSVAALQPGCAAGNSLPSTDRQTALARAFLQAISQGRLPAYLKEFGATRPVVQGLSDTHGSMLLERLSGVSLPLSAGNYLVHDQQRIDVLLPRAEQATDGMVGAAQFVFVEAGDGPQLRMVVFGPSGDRAPAATVVRPGSSNRQVQQAYDTLAANAGGTLFFAAGTHRIALVLTSRNVRIAGAGMGTTILMPAANDRPVLEGAYNSGSWTIVEIADLSVIGEGGGCGFQAGHVQRQAQDEFVGRTLFRNVRFEQLGTCISRPYGQIGLWLQNCVFGAADYHLSSIGTTSPGEPMHAGNLVARDCHFSGASKAVFLMRSSAVGTGQITLDNCIMELNPGYVFYIDALNGVEGVPGMLVQSCWNEQNATASSVTVDRPQPPVYAFLKNTSLVRFEDTPIGSLKLENSTVVTRDCALDQLKAVSADRMSTLTHQDARGFGTFAPKGLVASIAAAYQFGPNRALSFAMPLRAWEKFGGNRGQPLLSHRGGTIAVQGGAMQASRPIQAATHRGVDQALRVEPGEHVHLLPKGAVSRGQWIAWIIDCRLAAGPPVALTVTGSAGVSFGFPIDHAAPRSIAGMTWCDAPVEELHFELAGADAGRSTIEIGRYEITMFGHRQDALAYLSTSTRGVA